MPVSARVAWSYLAVVLAFVGAAGLEVLSNQTVAVLACTSAGDGDAVAGCKVGWLIWVGVIGFLMCLLPALLLVKLDAWLWAGMVAAAGFLVVGDAITEWWWWVIAALVPAIAALATADWNRGVLFRRWQLVLILALDLAAAATLVWWYQQA